jgi:hypothetical protein
VPNQCGKAFAISVLSRTAPIKTIGIELALASVRAGLLKRTIERLGELRFIHFAQWVVIKRDRFPYFGPPQPRETLNYDYMLFVSNFNGGWEDYISSFSEVVPGGLDAVWRLSVQFPGSRPITPFLQYIRNSMYQTNYYYSAYPGATTSDILQALQLTDELKDLVQSTAGAGPDEFATSYDRFLSRVQGCLGSTGARE